MSTDEELTMSDDDDVKFLARGGLKNSGEVVDRLEVGSEGAALVSVRLGTDTYKVYYCHKPEDTPREIERTFAAPPANAILAEGSAGKAKLVEAVAFREVLANVPLKKPVWRVVPTEHLEQYVDGKSFAEIVFPHQTEAQVAHCPPPNNYWQPAVQFGSKFVFCQLRHRLALGSLLELSGSTPPRKGHIKYKVRQQDEELVAKRAVRRVTICHANSGSLLPEGGDFVTACVAVKLPEEFGDKWMIVDSHIWDRTAAAAWTIREWPESNGADSPTEYKDLTLEKQGGKLKGFSVEKFVLPEIPQAAVAGNPKGGKWMAFEGTSNDSDDDEKVTVWVNTDTWEAFLFPKTTLGSNAATSLVFEEGQWLLRFRNKSSGVRLGDVQLPASEPPRRVGTMTASRSYKPRCYEDLALLRKAFALNAEMQWGQNTTTSHPLNFAVSFGLGDVPSELRAADYAEIEAAHRIGRFFGAPCWWASSNSPSYVSCGSFVGLSTGGALEVSHVCNPSVKFTLASFLWFGVIDVREGVTAANIAMAPPELEHLLVVPRETKPGMIEVVNNCLVVAQETVERPSPRMGIEGLLGLSGVMNGKWKTEVHDPHCIIAWHESISEAEAKKFVKTGAEAHNVEPRRRRWRSDKDSSAPPETEPLSAFKWTKAFEMGNAFCEIVGCERVLSRRIAEYLAKPTDQHYSVASDGLQVRATTCNEQVAIVSLASYDRLEVGGYPVGRPDFCTTKVKKWFFNTTDMSYEEWSWKKIDEDYRYSACLGRHGECVGFWQVEGRYTTFSLEVLPPVAGKLVRLVRLRVV